MPLNNLDSIFSSSISKRTSPVEALATALLAPCLVKYVVTVSAQLPQVIPSTIHCTDLLISQSYENENSVCVTFISFITFAK